LAAARRLRAARLGGVHIGPRLFFLQREERLDGGRDTRVRNAMPHAGARFFAAFSALPRLVARIC